MAKEPFLPLFFGDFLASTAEWEGEERALYLLLLGYQWSLGSLPEEPRRVCKLVGWDWHLFERCWQAIAPKFQANAGRLLNQRLEQHRARSHQISEKRAAAGSIGGKASQAIARAARDQLVDTTKAIAPNLLDPPSHPIPSHSSPESYSVSHHSVANSVGAQSERAARAATARRLPAEFELTESRRETAAKEGADPDREFAKFTDHWRASSGANARKHDWEAAWRNWCRKAGDMRPRANGATRRVYRDAPTTAELEALEAARAGK